MKTLIGLIALFCAATYAAPSYVVSSGSTTYTDLATWTEVPLGDDELSMPIAPSGFSFNYFQYPHTEFRIGSNGYILFGNYMLTTSNKPDHQTAGNSISAMWVDLIPTKATSAAHEIGYSFSGGVLTVEWYNVYERYTGPGLFFIGVRMQIILDTNTDVIEIRWDAPTTFQTIGSTSTEVDCVAISAQPGIVPHEIIDGYDNGYIDANGTVKTYPAKRYVRFTPATTGGPNITTTSPLPNGTAGAAYSQQFAASGGVSPYTWSASGLPSGWTMSTSGLLSASSGNVAVGTYNFPVTVTDSTSAFDTQTFQVRINPQALVITTASPLPPGTAGQAYSQQFAATGGISPYNWSATGLPAGWTISAGGLLSASAGNVVAGTYNFNVTVTDSATPTAAQDTDPFSVNIVASGSPLTISTASPLPAGTAGVAYSQQFNATGGTSPYSWSATGLPSGWSISSSGLLSVTAGNVVAGTFNFSVTVTDSATPTAGQDTDPFSVTINAPPALVITTTTLAGGNVGSPYAATITAQNGGSSYTWSITSGSLPPGVTGIPGSGTPSIGLSGVPAAAGVYSFTVQVSDGTSTDSQPFTITIALAGGGIGGGGGGGGCTTDTQQAPWWLVAFALLGAMKFARRRA